MLKRLLIALLLFVPSLEAATYYASISGSGTTCSIGSPCSISQAINTKATAPDDIVNINDGTYSICGLTGNSGTSGHPIVIQSTNDLGAVLTCTTAGATSTTGPFLLTDKDYITIGTSGHGIYFKDSNNQVVIHLVANTSNMDGIKIEYNKFENNGNRGFQANGNAGNMSRQIRTLTPSGSGYIFTVAVNHNLFTGNYGIGFYPNNSIATYTFNTDTLRKSSQGDSFNGYHYNALAFRAGNGGGPSVASDNVVSYYVKDSYANPTGVGTICNSGQGGICTYTANAFRADTGASNITFTRNIIHDLDYVDGSTSIGIFSESGCNNITATYNQVYRVGEEAFLMGSYNTTQNTGNNFSWNTMWDCGCGVIISNARNFTVKNNIFNGGTKSNSAVIVTDKGTTGGFWANNNWYNPNTANVGLTGAINGSCVVGNKTRTALVGVTGETGGIGLNPLYVNTTAGAEDLNLQAGSPSIHAADDGSNQGFAPLANPPPSATIALVYPNGGEDLITGTSIPITWVTTQSGNCSIELNRGQVWETLSASTTCTSQTFPWTVTPPGLVTSALFRVTSLSAPTVTDTSDMAAHIHGDKVSVLP